MTQPHSAPVASVARDAAPPPIGAGIDTSRYGHHASFLRPDLQPAAVDLSQGPQPATEKRQGSGTVRRARTSRPQEEA